MDENNNNDNSSSDIKVDVDGSVSEENTSQSVPITVKIEEPIHTDTQQEDDSKEQVTDIVSGESEIEIKQPPDVQEEEKVEQNDENDLEKEPETTPEPATQAEPLSHAESVPQEPVVVEQPADIVASKDTPLTENVESRLSSMKSEPAVVGVAASQMNKPPHPNNKKLTVAVTVIVAVLMSVVAVYVYLGTNKNTEESREELSTQNENNADQKDVTPATTEDIDSANQDVEETINSLNDEEDFPEEDISDSTLGL